MTSMDKAGWSGSSSYGKLVTSANILDISATEYKFVQNNYMEGSGSATIKPEDQWSCKRSPDILA